MLENLVFLKARNHIRKALWITVIVAASALLLFSLQNKVATSAWNHMTRSWDTNVIKLCHPLIEQPVYNVKTSANIVAITVDDGPDPRYTPAILDIFESYNVKATFFLVGSEVEKHPDIAKRIFSEGHDIGNHTMTHPEMRNISYQEAIKEISSANAAIAKITGADIQYFRPPKGVTNELIHKTLLDMGYTTVLWDLGLENKNCKTPQEMSARVVNNVNPGNIILLHDGRLDRDKTVQALPAMLDGLRDKGYSFVTIAELMTHRAPN